MLTFFLDTRKIMLSALLIASSLLSDVYAQNNSLVDHGPYLQEVTADGATFVFNTRCKTISCVEITESGKTGGRIYYSSNHGLRHADTTFHTIRVEGLTPGKSYNYRIHAKEIKSFRPYQVSFGDSTTTRWFAFSTVDSKARGGSLFIVSDMHSRPQQLEQLLRACDYRTCSAFFYAGDMMNYMEQGGEHPYSSFIDMSAEMFASSIPFHFVRGNHETRGNLARMFPMFFPKTSGKIYGTAELGDILVIMLDSGEDKNDGHSVYAGMTDFNVYRSEQAEWLREVIKSKAFRKARYRIVISHFPMTIDKEEGDGWDGWQDAIDKFLPILNKAGIDLLVSGHTHRFSYYPAGHGGAAFPTIVQGYSSAARLDLHEGKIHAKVMDSKEKILFENEWKAR